MKDALISNHALLIKLILFL